MKMTLRDVTEEESGSSDSEVDDSENSDSEGDYCEGGREWSGAGEDGREWSGAGEGGMPLRELRMPLSCSWFKATNRRATIFTWTIYTAAYLCSRVCGLLDSGHVAQYDPTGRACQRRQRRASRRERWCMAGKKAYLL